MTSSLPSFVALTTSVVWSAVARICSTPRREGEEDMTKYSLRVVVDSRRLCAKRGYGLKAGAAGEAEGLRDHSIDGADRALCDGRTKEKAPRGFYAARGKLRIYATTRPFSSRTMRLRRAPR